MADKRCKIIKAEQYGEGRWKSWKIRVRHSNGTEWNAHVSDADYRLRRLKEKILAKGGITEKRLGEFEEIVREMVNQDRDEEEAGADL